MHRLSVVRDYLLGSLWFVPSWIVVASLGLAFGMVELSAHVDDEVLRRWPRLFGASADSSRSILSAIASGMITVAGLTFSLTMVAVTQASSQFAPRILRNFMSDRANQIVLGTFVGIFAYCLIVLRTIRSIDERSFVPSLAVVLGILLAIVGIGVLIYFVHHIASTLQASSVVARVARETVHSVDQLFPTSLGREAGDDVARAASFAAAVTTWYPVPSPSTGYVQSVDERGLLRIANDARRLIRMDHGVGEFVIEGQPFAAIAAEYGPAGLQGEHAAADRVPAHAPAGDDLETLGERVADTFVIGEYRTVEQDAEFGLRQLVDVAMKALSPGVNDTTTAVSCVDYLGAILVRIALRRIESPLRECEGEVRILARGPTFERMLRLACDEIRQNASGNVTILRRLMAMLAQVAKVTVDARRRQLLRAQLLLVREVVERTVDAAVERDELTAMSLAIEQVVGQAAASRLSSSSRLG